MPDLTLAGLISHLKDELNACEKAGDDGLPQLRAASVELDVSLAVVPGEGGESVLTLAQTQAEAASAGLHRARIRFEVGGGAGWRLAGDPQASAGGSEMPPSREALLPEPFAPNSTQVVDPEFNQTDFDRMMDEIEGVAKKKKKRKKS